MAAMAFTSAILLTLLSASLVGAAIDPSISLNVNTTTFKNGDFVTVSWSGVSNATEADVIALFVPANQSVDTVVPTKYKWINQVSSWQSGSGSLTFQLLNQRQDAIFYYFRDLYNPPVTGSDPLPGFTSAGISAKSQVLTLAAPNEPTQIHLSLTNISGQVILQWTTRDKGTPTAKLGTSSGSYSITKTGNYTTYTPADMCTSPANDTGYIFPGIFNQVLIDGLSPSTKYYYTVGDPTFGFSTELHFTTGPVVGPNSSIDIIFWADSGHAIADGSWEWEWSDNDPLMTSPPDTTEAVLAELIDIWQQDQAQQGASLNLTRRIAKEITDNTTLLIHQGDLSYARGLVSSWDVYMDQYSPLFNYVPYMVLPGNHERDAPDSGDRFWPLVNAGDSGGECGVPMERRFKMPFPAEGDQWYSFDHGPVHFLQTSTEQPFGAGSPQWNFVVADLKAVNRSLTPWVVVGFHRPFLTSSLYGHQLKSDIVVSNDLRSAFEDIFVQYQVDMTWNGHVHLYQRSCPVYKKQCQGYNATTGEANAPMHVDFGNGGFEYTWFANPDPPAYWDTFAMEHGYMKAQVNGTHFHVQAVSSETGNIIDDFTLVKPVGWKPDPKGKASFLDYFTGNYTPSAIEDPGLSSDAIWGAPLYTPALALFTNETLLQEIYKLNATLIEDPNLGDTAINIAQLLQLYYKQFKSEGYKDSFSSANSYSVAESILDDIFFPLIEKFTSRASQAEQSNGAFDAGLWVPAKNAGSPNAGQTVTSSSVAGRRLRRQA